MTATLEQPTRTENPTNLESETQETKIEERSIFDLKVGDWIQYEDNGTMRRDKILSIDSTSVHAIGRYNHPVGGDHIQNVFYFKNDTTTSRIIMASYPPQSFEYKEFARFL